VKVEEELLVELDRKDLCSRNGVKCTYPESYGMYQCLVGKE
jgi:hypothetical protein